jgi:hypothetical protein
MKTAIAAIIVALTLFVQAQDAAVVVEETTYDPFPIPALPALKVPAKGRAIPYDRKFARPVSVPLAKAVGGTRKAQGTPVLQLAAAKPTMMFTPFERKLLNDWVSPHGEAMSTLLKDIAAAKEAGDTNTYERLTQRYATWAEKYLRRGSKPSTKQTP